MLTEATKVWRKTNFRNLTLLKKLPRIEGSDHEGSLYHPAAKIDIGIQVDFASDLQAPEAQENSEISAVSELDRHVQVEAQPVPSDANVRHEALDTMVQLYNWYSYCTTTFVTTVTTLVKTAKFA